jgi:hypothetical protein
MKLGISELEIIFVIIYLIYIKSLNNSKILLSTTFQICMTAFMNVPIATKFQIKYLIILCVCRYLFELNSTCTISLSGKLLGLTFNNSELKFHIYLRYKLELFDFSGLKVKY